MFKQPVCKQGKCQPLLCVVHYKFIIVPSLQELSSQPRSGLLPCSSHRVLQEVMSSWKSKSIIQSNSVTFNFFFFFFHQEGHLNWMLMFRQIYWIFSSTAFVLTTSNQQYLENLSLRWISSPCVALVNFWSFFLVHLKKEKEAWGREGLPLRLLGEILQTWSYNFLSGWWMEKMIQLVSAWKEFPTLQNKGFHHVFCSRLNFSFHISPIQRLKHTLEASGVAAALLSGTVPITAKILLEAKHAECPQTSFIAHWQALASVLAGCNVNYMYLNQNPVLTAVCNSDKPMGRSPGVRWIQEELT